MSMNPACALTVAIVALGVPGAISGQSLPSACTQVSCDGVIARSTVVYLYNTTSKTLTRHAQGLSHGAWCQNLMPPGTIAPGACGSWGSEDDGTFTGTQGAATYNLQNGGSVVIDWDNPYWGSNKHSSSAPTGFSFSKTNGSGNHASIVFTLNLGS